MMNMEFNLEDAKRVWYKDGVKKGREEGKKEEKKEMAHDMFIDGESMAKIKKYSKLPDDDLADILRTLPTEIQARYSLCQ